MRKVAIGIAALLAVLVIAAFALPRFIDWNRYRGEIEARVWAATGQRLTIDGDIDLALLPRPALSVGSLRLANVKGASAGHMLALEGLTVNARLAPLLFGRLEVESVALVRPTVEIERLADGRLNWALAAEGSQGQSGGGQPAPAPATGGAESFQLDYLEVQDGTVVYRDPRANLVEEITGLEAELWADSLRGPFRLLAGATARGTPVSLEAAIGRMEEGRALSLGLVVDLLEGAGRVELAGSLSAPSAEGEFKGTLKVSAASAAALRGALSGERAGAA
ncbi:MAG: AsmA family protein, partial [Alphaproteobacteria bacterium]